MTSSKRCSTSSSGRLIRTSRWRCAGEQLHEHTYEFGYTGTGVGLEAPCLNEQPLVASKRNGSAMTPKSAHQTFSVMMNLLNARAQCCRTEPLYLKGARVRDTGAIQ